MNQEVKLPELGENIDHAIVASVLVAVGDRVQKEQALCEVETDKAVAELPSPGGGVVTEIRVGQGDEVEVGQVLMTLSNGAQAATPDSTTGHDNETDLSHLDTETTTTPAVSDTAQEQVTLQEAQEVKPAAHPDSARPTKSTPTAAILPLRPGSPPTDIPPQALAPAGPAARRLAREMGFDITEVTGSGPRGRISIADVKAHAELLITAHKKRPAPGAAVHGEPELPDFRRWGEIETRPLSGIRRATATAMATSWAVVPHVTQADRADITELDAQRRAYRSAGAKLTVTAVILKAAASALKIFEAVNASLDLKNHQVILKRHVHLGVAVDTERGLLVPVVRDADQKNALAIAGEIADLAARARARQLTAEEMQGATFTLTNLGGLGTTTFSPIVPWPQVAILGVGRANMEPVWQSDRFEPRLILPLSLSYDHRAIDGADAARFLRWIAEALEQPLKLVVEG